MNGVEPGSAVAAAARAAAARLGLTPGASGGRRLRALVEAMDRLRAWGEDAPDAPGAAALVEVVGRDAPLRPEDPWSLRLDARALAVGPLLGTGSAPGLAELIVPKLRGGLFLDAGGGLGDVTLAVLAAAPGTPALLVDVPAVAAAARRRLGAGVTVVAGDLREVELPPASVGLLANVLHMHGPEDAARIVARVGAAVETLVVKDLWRGSTRAALFDLCAAVHSDDGQTHDEARARAWLAAAGHRLESRVELGAAVVLVGVR